MATAPLPSPTPITVPPPSDVTLSPGEQYYFVVQTGCNLCFGVNPAFRGVTGAHFNFAAPGSSPTYTAPGYPNSITYDAVPLAQQCNPLSGTAKTIHISSSGRK